MNDGGNNSRCASRTFIDLISVGFTHGQVNTNDVLTWSSVHVGSARNINVV